MSLLERIRTEQIKARKGRGQTGAELRAKLLTTLLSEAQTVGFNDGKRESTDAEVIAVIKKFVKNIDETLTVTFSNNDLVTERQILMSFLPSQLSVTELTDIVYNIVDDIVEKLELSGPSMKMMGEVMKTLKKDYEGQFDGKTASDVVKKALTATT